MKYIHVVVWPSPSSISRTFSSPQTGYQWNTNSLFLFLSQTLLTTILLSGLCYFLPLCIGLPWGPHRNGTIQYLSFISLNMMPSRFIGVGVCARSPFLFWAELYSVVCTHHVLFIHSSVDGRPGGSHLSAVVNNAATDRAAQTSAQAPAFHLGCLSSYPVSLFALYFYSFQSPRIAFRGLCSMLSCKAQQQQQKKQTRLEKHFWQ